ncbi:rhodanese-like domain-containing protein [Lyngbya sp. CCY1209]|uniref:rhodanese-like domain-containing protein n=1 Tax=Lyngbya sp. CCY1209 TaxID=2886103 RepID=UPI002D210D6B|nr:rhodanese-like domain-containing protein [Lyngbya sp. CCY1209]MEB3884813.1 rhodanese-related sulfurtransferase [Lyngbya sp. CCY1209]
MSAQSFNQSFSEIDVRTLASCLQASPEAVQLIDVREPQELAIARVDGFLNYPLSEYQQWAEPILTDLDPHKETLVMCHHGRRSAQMCMWLVEQGFTDVKNIAGGIDAYAKAVDPSVPLY